MAGLKVVVGLFPPIEWDFRRRSACQSSWSGQGLVVVQFQAVELCLVIGSFRVIGPSPVADLFRAAEPWLGFGLSRAVGLGSDRSPVDRLN